MSKKVTSKTITREQIEEVKELLDYDDLDIENVTEYDKAFLAFYYNYMEQLDVCDIDRYANLNTILGYDVGFIKFRALDDYLWNHGFDLMELSGANQDKEMLQDATKKARLEPLDYSNWSDKHKEQYLYSFFENGVKFEQEPEKLSPREKITIELE